MATKTNNAINLRSTTFYAYVGVNALAATGDGTIYSVIPDQTLVNEGTCYDVSTGIFAAPVDGNYLFGTIVFLAGLTSANTSGNITFVNQNLVVQGNPFAQADSTGNLTWSGVSIFPMSKGTTNSVICQINGSMTANVAVTAIYTVFYGALLL